MPRCSHARAFLLFLGSILIPTALAQEGFKPNYDEAAVPAYQLPDPLVFANGRPVTNTADWKKRRAEILSHFQTHIYGQTPGEIPGDIIYQKRKSVDFLGGKAVLEEIRITVSTKSGTRPIDLLLIKPKAAETRKFRTFLTLNFRGNHSLHPSPEISLAESWQPKNPDIGVVKNRATEKSRGSRAARWPIETIIDSGTAFASICYHDIEPDSPLQYRQSVRALFDEPEADGWGAIGAWAWGLSRAMDYLETDPQVDSRRVAVMGHSRLGKTALWAAAQDERFALAISNNSGCGGAALSRRAYGETILRINHHFPHWFCKNFRQYNNNEAALPVDQHQLLSLIAPRMVHIASAEDDLWADLRGEFLAALHASPVWNLHGLKGIETREMPPLHQPVGTAVRYHIRAGEHDVTDYDWKQYIASLLAVP
jgi:hypothetical protein